MNNEFNRTWTDTDGYTVEIRREHTGTWIKVSNPGRPGSSTAFAPVIEPVTRKSDLEALRKLDKDPADYRTAAGRIIRATAVPFVEGVIAEMAAAKEAAAQQLERNVPGLAELRAARADEDRYAYELAAMMDDEQNDGARPPRPVATDSEALAARYPVAAAYLQAEDWEFAAHDVKSVAGRRAKQRIAAGEDYQLVLREMRAEWSDHVNQHAWD